MLNHIQHSGVPLKIKRLARDPNRFIWAVSIAQSRCINMQMRIGALVQDANMLIPYAGKFFAPKFLFITLSNILSPIKRNLIASCVCLELSIVNLSPCGILLENIKFILIAFVQHSIYMACNLSRSDVMLCVKLIFNFLI